MSETERTRFGELGVFPEDADIPVGVIARLWGATGGLEDFETEDLLSRLFDLSLLLDLDLGRRFFRLHDTIRQFLWDQAGKERVIEQHRDLVITNPQEIERIWLDALSRQMQTTLVEFRAAPGGWMPPQQIAEVRNYLLGRDQFLQQYWLPFAGTLSAYWLPHNAASGGRSAPGPRGSDRHLR